VKSHVYEERKKEQRHTMDMHSVVAMSPTTNVVEDNREILLIELPRIVDEDCG
jgi:hypothetical protein